jgi:tetratricopeptide (TPR) repeat protein
MPTDAANSSPAATILAVAVLLVGTWLVRPLEIRLEAARTPAAPATAQLVALAGNGMAGVLGGMRAVVAGGCWLKADLAWERRDAAATAALLDLTVAADERPLYYWLNGARMLADDMPQWLAPPSAPAAVRQRVVAAQAERALRFLEKGRRWHGTEAAFYVEMGNIHLRHTGDLDRAAECYRLAAEQPGAPYYAGRIAGELLRQAGRPAEALAWLRRVSRHLPPDDPAAGRELVRARIEALERQLATK